MTAQLADRRIELPETDEHPLIYTQPLQERKSTQDTVSAWFERAKNEGRPFLFSELKLNRTVQLAAGCSIAALLLVAGGLSALTAPSSHSVQTTASYPTPTAYQTTIARAPLPSPVRPVSVNRPANGGHGDDMAEFVRLGGKEPSHSGAPPAAVAQTSPATPFQAISSPATVPAPPAAAMAPTIPRALPSDAVTRAATLQARPMTDPQQVEVLELVTQLGTIVRDQRTEITELRHHQQELQHRVDTEIDDLHRRLALSEAHRALSAAATAGTDIAPTPPAPSVAPAPMPVAAEAPPLMAAHHIYHIQAASPGLAMLSEVDTSGNEVRQIPVAPGDDLPGFGHVSDIAQSGTSWVIKTEHGLIQ